MYRVAGRTRGTETSKYPQEKKETSIPSVAASERGDSPNRASARGCGSLEGLQNRRQPKRLGRRTRAGDSPVGDVDRSPLPEALQSSMELVKLRVKRGGPPPKAKYSSMTDSGQVGRLNDEKHSDELSEKHLKPCTYKRSESYGPEQSGQGMTAYLLHNGPASSRLQQG
jgi:hypothetical protein